MSKFERQLVAYRQRNVKPKRPTDCASPTCAGRSTRGCGLCGKCCASKHFEREKRTAACSEAGPGTIWEPCEGCNGFGSFTGGASCQSCGGKGQIAR